MGMSNNPLPWVDDTPESLVQLCARNVVENPDTICDRYIDFCSLKPGLALPQEICEKLVSVRQEVDPEKLNDDFVGIFSDPYSTRLKRVGLRNAAISNEGLLVLLRHKLHEIDISGCNYLTECTLSNINQFGETLTSLTLCNNAVPQSYLLSKCFYDTAKEQGHIINTPNLRKLVLRNFKPPERIKFFHLLLKPLKNLVHLDLSGCSNICDFSYAQHLQNLNALILHEVKDVRDAIQSVCLLTSLRFLDISKENSDYSVFMSPNNVLEKIVINLPHLTGLDISGTNLAGNGTFEGQSKYGDKLPKNDVKMGDIPGLQSRMKKPLRFLGLYNAHNDASHRFSIPADVITGDANESQILAAAEAYLDRPSILVKALNELFHLFRYETCVNQAKALNLILSAMKRHKTEKHIQISGSASLYYIAKNDDKLSFYARKMIITVLLDAMEKHIEDATMLRNGCLTICQFSIPQDVVFSYKRIVNLLLKLVKPDKYIDEFVRRIAIYLLNSLACQVHGQQKELIGNLGAIETMLWLINDRLTNNRPDDVMEIAWSAMWNVTDETPINCKRFLDGEGMKCFHSCLMKFPEKEELLRNMMGLLGNVAEVEYLRPRLITSPLIETFAYLLESNSDGIEVSYNAAGVLAHIMSDGPIAWAIDHPSRDRVLLNMVSAVNRWDLNSKRNINYRSFEPILRLLQVHHTPECQLWGVWALASLTKVYPDKYCTLVEEEGGIPLLEAFFKTPSTPPEVKRLAGMVLIKIQLQKNPDANLSEEETEDGI